MPIGVPSVFPSKMPDQISGTSSSLRCVTGFDYNQSLYPQKTPAETIGSIVKAIDNKRIDYMLAQIAEPKFVDAQVAQYKALFTKGKDEARTFLAFDRLVNETVEYFLSDPV